MMKEQQKISTRTLLRMVLLHLYKVVLSLTPTPGTLATYDSDTDILTELDTLEFILRDTWTWEGWMGNRKTQNFPYGTDIDSQGKSITAFALHAVEKDIALSVVARRSLPSTVAMSKSKKIPVVPKVTGSVMMSLFCEMSRCRIFSFSQ